jgi:hypothetical protein
MHAEVFAQSPYRCRLDWGRHGARAAAERQDILVIVDTLSFSTAVVTAVQGGGLVYPCAEDEQPGALAQRIGGEVAVRRKDVPAKGRFSLSPLTYLHLAPGTRIVLASPNGATCSRHARAVPFLFVGALVNAEAVATVVSHLLDTTDRCVTIIACRGTLAAPLSGRCSACSPGGLPGGRGDPGVSALRAVTRGTRLRQCFHTQPSRHRRATLGVWQRARTAEDGFP